MMDMSIPTYCSVCGKFHEGDRCVLSTKPKVLATPLSTLGEVATVRVSRSQKQSGYDRLKKWRGEHREEYNARMREYRKANRVG